MSAAQRATRDADGCPKCGRDACEGGCAATYRQLRPVSVADIYADDKLGALTWLWQDFIPEGSITMLAGYMKTGKTTMAYALAGAIVGGRPFLGRATKKTGALFLVLEEHMRDAKRHLQDAGIGPEERVVVHAGMFSDPAEAVAEIRECMKAQGLGLLVVDTLSRFWTVESENDNAQAVAALGPLIDLAHRDGITVLLLHHTGKREEEGAATGRAIRGASAIFGLMDQALILRRTKGGPPTVRALDSIGRYSETPRETIIDFDEETASYLVVDSTGNTSDERREIRARKLLGHIAEHPGCSRREAVLGAKVKRSDGYAVLAWLIASGRVVEVARGLEVVPGAWGTTGNHGNRFRGSGAPHGGVPGTTAGNRSDLAEPGGTTDEE